MNLSSSHLCWSLLWGSLCWAFTFARPLPLQRLGYLFGQHFPVGDVDGRGGFFQSYLGIEVVVVTVTVTGCLDVFFVDSGIGRFCVDGVIPYEVGFL